MSVTFTATGTSDEMGVNMNNRNAALLIEALGFAVTNEDGEFGVGSSDAHDFQGRVLLALALSPADEGMPSYEHQGAGARMIEGARRPGYLQERLGQLHELASWAVLHGAEVYWS